MRRTLAAAAGAGAILAAGCGGPQPPAEPAVREVPEIARVEADAADLTGRWAQLQVTTSESNSALAGTVRSVNRRVFLYDVTETDGALEVRGELCSMDVETSTSLADTVVPSAFVDAFPEAHLVGAVERGDHGVGITFAPVVETLGLDLAAGADTDALPGDADDPRVTDPDGDGNPGVTIRVTGLAGGEMYFAQRAERALTVTEVDANRIDGTISWQGERVVLGATSRQLRNARPSVATESPEENWFRTTRVRADVDCAAVIDAGRALFDRGLALEEGSGEPAAE